MQINLTLDLLIQGAIGLVLFFAGVRQFLTQMAAARAAMKPTSNALVTAVSIGWSADQIERGLQALETVAKAATTYDVAARNRSEKLLEDLLQRLKDAEEDRLRDRLVGRD